MRWWGRTAIALTALMLFSGCVIMELPQYAAGAIDLFNEEPAQLHVAPWGDDTNPGTKALPYQTIQFALSQIPIQDIQDREIRIAAGTYTPGNGLIRGGDHGVMYDFNYHQPLELDVIATISLTFGWNRLFSTNDPSQGGGTSVLNGAGVYTGGASAVVLAFYDRDGNRQIVHDNLETTFGTPVTVFNWGVIGDEIELVVSGSLEVTP